MILVKLRGGLSNQMFQYAAARRLAAAHATGVRIDNSWYSAIPDGATLRSYELDKLEVTGSLASEWETIGTDGFRNTAMRHRPIALARMIRPRYRFVAERHFHFDPRILELPDDVCLFGYWLSERYFADIADVIRQEFRFRAAPSERNAALIRQMGSHESVAVHVRRGDYAALPALAGTHGLCEPQYYAAAADVIRETVGNPVFYIFSDDLEWAAANLSLGGDVILVDHNRDADSSEDLRLMAAARHSIIANSGFSWWGAWLNTSEERVVCAPRRWMADPAYDTRDVLPARWRTL